MNQENVNLILDAAIDKYAQMCVNNMSTDDLMQIVKDSICDGFHDLSEASVIREILTDFPDDFPELAHCA